MFKNEAIRYVDINEINKHLKYVKKNKIVYFRGKTREESFKQNAYIEDSMVNFSLSYKFGKRACTYIFRKDDTQAEQKITGLTAFRTLNQYYKIPRFDKQPFSASPFLWKNPKYERQKHLACGYDMNSAYAFGMLQDMPNTLYKPKTKIVEENEIGFDGNGDFVELGHYAMFVFPKMESPFKRFVEVWYNRKKDPEQKAKAKQMLVYAVGYLQKHNCFLRSAIINYCNNCIKSLIDENTLYCNTDSIVSLKQRPDLPLGAEVGQFKIEHKGVFAYDGFNHQWYNDTIAYRGIPKSWFPKDYDILISSLPINGNIYVFDKVKLELKKVTTGGQNDI